MALEAVKLRNSYVLRKKPIKYFMIGKQFRQLTPGSTPMPMKAP